METMRKRLWILILVLAGVLCLEEQVQAAPPADAEEWCGHYYKVYNIDTNPIEAQNYCKSLGGYLASSTSQKENEYLVSLMEKNPKSSDLWLGGTDYGHEGIWEWLSGEEWNWTNWDNGQPDNYGGSTEYLQMFFGARGYGKWDDCWDGSATDNRDFLSVNGETASI